jgi:3-oxoacyl-[acyl-carrier protein] reductase
MLTIDLKDKVALVLGGSRGIGGAITESLAHAGARVFFTHTGNSRYEKSLAAFVQELHRAGRTVRGIVADARDPGQTASLVQAVVKEENRIDLLVCNVGQNSARPAEEVSDDEWHRFIETNLSSAFYAVRAVLPYMLNRRYGRIILIGSSAAYDGGGGAIDYAAAKAGLNGMMLYLCKQYARKGILTNVVHPCVIDTDLLKERYDDPIKREQLVVQIPAGRLGSPKDIAGLVAYLASSWGDYVCGQAILVDGGRTFFR